MCCVREAYRPHIILGDPAPPTPCSGRPRLAGNPASSVAPHWEARGLERCGHWKGCDFHQNSHVAFGQSVRVCWHQSIPAKPMISGKTVSRKAKEWVNSPTPCRASHEVSWGQTVPGAPRPSLRACPGARAGELGRGQVSGVDSPSSAP